MNKSVALTSLAWGLFFVVIGVSWALSSYYTVDMIPIVSLSVGIILIGINIARTSLGMPLSKFSLFIGIIALAFGGAALMGYSLPLWQTIIVLIGLFIIAEAVRSLTKKP
ncbi:hypothetical protein HXY32_08255 [Candidatus Bathyarchaeota archaeon]|nr:hypothetical protein [Candidatus Bathyarchaeota archaeon]